MSEFNSCLSGGLSCQTVRSMRSVSALFTTDSLVPALCPADGRYIIHICGEINKRMTKWVLKREKNKFNWNYLSQNLISQLLSSFLFSLICKFVKLSASFHTVELNCTIINCCLLTLFLKTVRLGLKFHMDQLSPFCCMARDPNYNW